MYGTVTKLTATCLIYTLKSRYHYSLFMAFSSHALLLKTLCSKHFSDHLCLRHVILDELSVDKGDSGGFFYSDSVYRSSDTVESGC